MHDRLIFPASLISLAYVVAPQLTPLPHRLLEFRLQILQAMIAPLTLRRLLAFCSATNLWRMKMVDHLQDNERQSIRIHSSRGARTAAQWSCLQYYEL
jgi:hypothetical protein